MLYGQGGLFAAALGKVLGDDIGHAVTQADVFEQIVQVSKPSSLRTWEMRWLGRFARLVSTFARLRLRRRRPRVRDSVTC